MKRNPKTEGRRPKEVRMPKPELRKVRVIRTSGLGLLSDFGLRVFGLCLVVLAFAGCDRLAQRDKDEDKAKHEEHEKSEARGPSGVVKLAGEALKNAAIETAAAGKRTLSEKVLVTARVEFDPSRSARPSVLLDGRVIEVKAEVGQRVKAGDVLARVETPETLGEPVAVRAPRDGVVTERKVSLGEHADKTAALFTITDTLVVWVIVEVPQLHLAQVKLGDTLELVEPSTIHNSLFTGRLTYLGHEASADTMTSLVRLEVANLDGRLRPGMRLLARVPTGKTIEALTVPEAAVQTVEDHHAVFVVGKEAGEFSLRRVEVGETLGGWTEVRAGLQTGERVATRGSFVLKSELLKSELQEKD